MPKKLPKYVSVERSRHGKVCFYFRRCQGHRWRMPDEIGSPAFKKAYANALAGAETEYPKPLPRAQVVEEANRRRSTAAMKSAVRQARKRARMKGVAFDLTVEWALDELTRQKFRCALSHIPFYAPHEKKTKHNPYMPSLDRIVPALGYTQGNVRIVCFAINMMMADWGEETLLRVANSYRYERRVAVKHKRKKERA